MIRSRKTPAGSVTALTRLSSIILPFTARSDAGDGSLESNPRKTKGAKDEASGTIAAVQEFLCALRCFSSQNRAWEQLRADLHPATRSACRGPRACGARNDLLFCALRPDCAAFDSPWQAQGRCRLSAQVRPYTCLVARNMERILLRSQREIHHRDTGKTRIRIKRNS